MREIPTPYGHPSIEDGDLLGRLNQLRVVLPVLGEELAKARRQASRVRAENARLRRHVAALEARGGNGTAHDHGGVKWARQ